MKKEIRILTVIGVCASTKEGYRLDWMRGEDKDIMTVTGVDDESILMKVELLDDGPLKLVRYFRDAVNSNRTFRRVYGVENTDIILIVDCDIYGALYLELYRESDDKRILMPIARADYRLGVLRI